MKIVKSDQINPGIENPNPDFQINGGKKCNTCAFFENCLCKLNAVSVEKDPEDWCGQHETKVELLCG